MTEEDELRKGWEAYTNEYRKIHVGEVWQKGDDEDPKFRLVVEVVGDMVKVVPCDFTGQKIQNPLRGSTRWVQSKRFAGTGKKTWRKFSL